MTRRPKRTRWRVRLAGSAWLPGFITDRREARALRAWGFIVAAVR